MSAKNPYAKADGSPMDGKEFEFLEWSQKKDKERLSSLTKENRERIKKARNRMQDKMQS